MKGEQIVSCGKRFRFNINDVSKLDINDLIDIGYRFDLVDPIKFKDMFDEDELDDIREIKEKFKHGV